MKKEFRKITAIAGLLALLLGVLAAAMPAQASGPGQATTPAAPGATVMATQGIPQTGNGNGTAGVMTSTWLLVVIIAVALVAIIIGTIARGSNRTL